MSVPEGGYIVLKFVRGPEAPAEVMENVDDYSSLTLKHIFAEAEQVCRVQIYQAR